MFMAEVTKYLKVKLITILNRGVNLAKQAKQVKQAKNHANCIFI